MQFCFRRFGVMVFGLFASVSAPLSANSQATPTVSQIPVRASRMEVYGAYSYFHPVNADITGTELRPINVGTIAGANYYFNRFIGVQVEGTLSPSHFTGTNTCIGTLEAGPVARYQMRRFIPFAHATAGGVKSGGPLFQKCEWGWGVTGGLGMDYIVPGLGEHLAIRPIQADYEYNHVDHGPLLFGGLDGGMMNMNAYRLSSGIVLRFGNLTPPPALGMSCSVTPGDVFAGEPITGKAETIYLDTHKKAKYTWTTNGGNISGNGDTVQIDTAGLQPGNYVLTGHLEQGRMQEQKADCNAHFAIKEVPIPPTITCAASPYSVHPGENSTITSTVTNPQHRLLTYNYAATAGSIRSDGPTATLNTSGSAAGTITATCSVTDDMGKTATANTTVQVMPAVLPPAPQTQALCTIAFDRDTKRPARVDNEAKGCLDDVALALQRQSDAHLVIVGSRTASESPDLAAERSMNTKLYLTWEKGIDPSRIQLRTGDTSGRHASQTLVPASAVFADAGTSELDESVVKISRHPYSVSKTKIVRAIRKSKHKN